MLRLHYLFVIVSLFHSFKLSHVKISSRIYSTMSTDKIQSDSKKHVNNVIKSILTSILLTTSIYPVHATDLGTHSGCAYPACTNQLEVGAITQIFKVSEYC